MSHSTPESLRTARPESAAGPDPRAGDVRDRLIELADRSGNAMEFFEQLAKELQSQFSAAAVYLTSECWPRPIVCGPDSELQSQIDDEIVRTLLETATPAPISCDVPIRCSSTHERPRALRVELAPGPQRITSLILYDRLHCPPTVRQLDDLRLLRDYAQATRHVLASPKLTQTPASTEPAVHRVDEGRRANRDSINRGALSRFHTNLDLSQTCYRIANESRRIIDCDRVTILVRQHSRYHVHSVSGVAVVNRRSNTIAALERMANAAIVLDKPIALPGSEPLPSQIQEPLDDYLDESGVSSAVLVPLRSGCDDEPSETETKRATATVTAPLGILLLENFSGTPTRPIDVGVEAAASEAGIALRNAIEHHSIVGLTIWKSLGKVIRVSRKPLWFLLTAMLFALLAAGFMWQVEHVVVATGTVKPASERALFAAGDGIVRRVHVRDGQEVSAGALLLELENPELENRAEALAGEIQTLTGRLTSIHSLRLSGRGEDDQSSRLALEARQIESELANLRSQQEVLSLQLADLTVTSPIAGTVLAWQIERRLMGRPVTRGNLLCAVADPHSRWLLSLEVPEQHAGPLIGAARGPSPIDVRFAVATMPKQTIHARVDELSSATRMDPSGMRVIDVTATVEATSDGEAGSGLNATGLRVGADVTARIACGKRPLLLSWFSDVIDFVNRHVLFRFR